MRFPAQPEEVASNMNFLGIDIGSSSIKVALVDSETGRSLGVVQVPDREMSMQAPRKGWAEQDPGDWWQLVCEGIRKALKACAVPAEAIAGIGISYQMHGLVVVDKTGQPLRSSIIWCDSRAVEIGRKAAADLGPGICAARLLNSPGNFTASKLKWVKDHEPETFGRVHKMMLPGDYIAYRLTGEIRTTVCGLSEGILWDYRSDTVSEALLDYFGFRPEIIPDRVPAFGLQGTVSKTGASESGLREGTPLLYRAGDQPNNALSLNVFRPGEVAATGGTSGVVYALRDSPDIRESTRVNHFAHVNYRPGGEKIIGTLLCINGAGIQYRWLRDNLGVDSYEEMNRLASRVAVGADGVCLIPFGNGAERMLENREVGSHICHLDLNRHSRAHLCRAALEGIAFAFAYGVEILGADGLKARVLRAGNDNLFRSGIFADTLATLTGMEIGIFNTTGAVGAARACILRDGAYGSFASFTKNDHVATRTPLADGESYRAAYTRWKGQLEYLLENQTH